MSNSFTFFRGASAAVIATPFFHRWHHTNDARRDRNYAAMFPFVDHVFGTYQSPDQWPAGYGIDTAMPASIGGQLLEPFMPWPDARPNVEAAATTGGEPDSIGLAHATAPIAARAKGQAAR